MWLFYFARQVAFNAGKLRNVTEIYGVFEWPLACVTSLAIKFCQIAELNRMSVRSHLNVLLRRRCRVVDHRVTYVAIIPDYFAGIAHMFPIMTAETS